MITAEERQKLWEQYPEIRALFEEFNGALLEDDAAWTWFIDRCHGIWEAYRGSSVVEILLQDVAYTLDKIAKKRRFG